MLRTARLLCRVRDTAVLFLAYAEALAVSMGTRKLVPQLCGLFLSSAKMAGQCPPRLLADPRFPLVLADFSSPLRPTWIRNLEEHSDVYVL
jgi:hypothetical protein